MEPLFTSIVWLTARLRARGRRQEVTPCGAGQSGPPLQLSPGPRRYGLGSLPLGPRWRRQRSEPRPPFRDGSSDSRASLEVGAGAVAVRMAAGTPPPRRAALRRAALRQAATAWVVLAVLSERQAHQPSNNIRLMCRYSRGFCNSLLYHRMQLFKVKVMPTDLCVDAKRNAYH